MKFARVAALLLFTSSGVAAETATVPRFTDPTRRAKLEAVFPEVEKAFERFRVERGIPGLVFGIVIDGETALVKGLGVRDREFNDPATPDTVFRIASMTKSFTAMAILKLRDEGRLSLDDPASRWIPQFSTLRYPTKDSPQITIRDLLTHGAGFPEDNPWGDRQLATGEPTLSRWLEAGLPFSTPPDTAFEYSNYGFALLGRIVSKASGVPYRDYIEKNILAPLGMKSSTLDPDSVPRAVRATGYRKSGDTYMPEPSLPHGAFGAMGGLLTSGRDLGRYVAFLLSAFPPRDEDERGPVRRSSLREMQKPWRASAFGAIRPSPAAPLNSFAISYGFGLSVRQDCRFNRIISHGGGLPGFGSTMVWLPDYGLGIFAMANLTYAGPAAPADEALDLFRKTGALKPRELPPSPALLSTQAAIVRLWKEWNDGEAKALAADNLFLDMPASERRDAIERLKKDLGPCQAPGPVEPENLLRGRFRMTCERGHADAVFTLAPTMPPKVQSLRFTRTLAMEPRMKEAAEAVAGLVGSFREEALASLAAPPLDTVGLRAQLDSLRVAYGSCRTGDLLSGNGTTDSHLLFQCDRGSLDVGLELDGEGRLLGATFSRPPGTPCVQ